MTDSPPPQVPLPATPPGAEHAQDHQAQRTFYTQVTLSAAIPTITGGIVFALTGDLENAAPAAFVAGQFYATYLVFIRKEQRGALILMSTAILSLQLFSSQYEYREHIAAERASNTAQEKVLFAISEAQAGIQNSTKAIAHAIDSSPLERGDSLNELFQERDRAIKTLLGRSIEERLYSQAPLVTKEELRTRQIRSTVFGSLMLVCAGLYLFTLRTHYRIIYGAIEVVFAAAATVAAMVELLDADGASKWIGIGAAIYLLVRGLDNVEQGWNKRQKPNESSSPVSNSEVPATTPPQEKLPASTPLPATEGTEVRDSTGHQYLDATTRDIKADAHSALSPESKTNSSS